VARRKINKKQTLEEILEKKKVILTALAKASEDNLFLQASTDAFDGAFADYYAPSQYDIAVLVDENNMLAS
jgi:hypothetical protein